MDQSKYWNRIKSNIEILYTKGLIKYNYSYDDFCNDFIPSEEPEYDEMTAECICTHPIKYNYIYTHKNSTDYFILGSCCIKKFSKKYKEKRLCLDCNITIRLNKENRCRNCKIIKKRQIEEEQKYLESCKCKECGYQKKDNKYKYCFICYKKKYNK